jgi:hypothetical protein
MKKLEVATAIKFVRSLMQRTLLPQKKIKTNKKKEQKVALKRKMRPLKLIVVVSGFMARKAVNSTRRRVQTMLMWVV